MGMLASVAGLTLFLQQPSTDSGGGMGFMLQIVLMFVVFGAVTYFMVIRPQRRRQQEHQALMESLKRGDEVITTGGIYGKIKKVEKDHIVLEVDEEGRTLKIMRDSVIEKEKAA